MNAGPDIDPAGAVAYAADKGEAAPPADPALARDIAIANRILARQGVVDAFGHISVRHDKRPDRFLLARNMAPALVTAEDVIEFDLDGNPINAAGRTVYLERFIHGEIYRMRPDVLSVVHSHAPAVVPFSVVKTVPLRAVCHMSGFIGETTPNFDIRDAAGDATDLLIRSRELGAALARVLGPSSLVLMRGHGSTCVGGSIPQAVYRAIYTDVNARLQAEAMRLGPVTFLTAGEARSAMLSTEGQVKRAWDYWRMQVEPAS